MTEEKSVSMYEMINFLVGKYREWENSQYLNGISSWDKTFEELFSSPYCWKSERHSDFWNETWEITEPYEDVKKEYDESCPRSLHMIVYNSAPQLEANHPSDLWYARKILGKKPDYDPIKRARLWLTWSPNFSYYVWVCYQDYRDILIQYYLARIQYPIPEQILTVEQFLLKLQNACNQQKKKVFKMDGHEIELRGMDSQLLNRVLAENSVAQILVADGTMTVSWNSDPEDIIQYDIDRSSNNSIFLAEPEDNSSGASGDDNDGKTKAVEQATYLFTNTFINGENSILEKVSLKTDKVVVFVAYGLLREVTKFCKASVCFVRAKSNK